MLNELTALNYFTKLKTCVFLFLLNKQLIYIRFLVIKVFNYKYEFKYTYI